MAINFKHDAIIEHLNFEGKEESKPSGIISSNKLTGIEVRISRAYIIDNNTPKVWPFPGFSQLYFLVVVISDKGNYLQKLEISGFPKVDDDEELPVDKSIYYWKANNNDIENPSQIHILSSIIKSKEKLRSAGNIMADINNDKEFGNLVKSLGTILNQATPVGQISDLLFSIASVIGKFLGKVEDKPLFTWVQSFTDINGDFDNLGKRKVKQENRNAILELSVIVRDKERELLLAEKNNQIIEELEIDEKGFLA